MQSLLQVAIKFFAQQAKYQHERLFYETRAALDAEARLEAIPEMLAAFAGPAAVDTASQTPASLVLEAGDFTLQASPYIPVSVCVRQCVCGGSGARGGGGGGGAALYYVLAPALAAASRL